MKKVEYSFVRSAEDRLHTLDTEKLEDYTLPEFSREVPLSTRKQETEHGVSLEHSWKASKCESIRIKKVTFRKGEELTDLYRIAARDGADSITFKHNNATYIIRKTVREIAEALYNAYGKIKGALEQIVGYLRTVLGNDYVISKVDHDSWVFDKRIAKNGIHYVDVDGLDKRNKSKLVEMLTEKIAELHSSNLIIGRFTLNNILLGSNDVKLTDLRKLRVSRKRSFVIEEFKAILQYLFAVGVAQREDVYASIAYYATKNEDSCGEWYRDRTGKKPSDTLDIARKMEEEVYS
ncbi:Uncharacterised protein [Candidatus Bilamarchaeum dharawalense]|uniref:Uncharacterized protein n=1 Tax=Candidatus Bilamarchaeum dharawalense TaxID=2885759 RepID=A0A5E4LTX6_9ARCH|nr:Uncharacterised protein [Candidatus Bilamarchaeum dharawalense]